MTFALRLLAIVVFLLALLCGGCSILAASIVFAEGDSDILLVLAIGFVPAGLLIWGSIALWRRTRKSTPPPGPDTFR